MDIGQKIKQCRKQNKMTQKELALKSDVPIITIQQYETGKRKNPKRDILKRLADALEVSLITLYDDEDEIEAAPEGDYSVAADDLSEGEYQHLKTFVGGISNLSVVLSPNGKIEQDIYVNTIGLINTVMDMCDGTGKTVYLDSVADRIKFIENYIKDNRQLIMKAMPGRMNRDI